MHRTLLTLLTAVSTTALALTGAAPAHADPYPFLPSLCTSVWLDAVGSDSPEDGMRDIAVASFRCADPSLALRQVGIAFQWWWFDFREEPGAFGSIGACPTTAAPATTVPSAGALVIAGAAVCEQPVSSPAHDVGRLVCADLVVDGEPTWTTSPFPGGAHCVAVPQTSATA